MDWDDLRIFLAVAREESLSGAGRVLRRDPATVGRRVQRLEEALSTNLFLKFPQGYDLTDAGERLLAHAERVETATVEAQSALAGPSDRLSGQVRIGAPDGCANYLLPQVCTQIGRDNPDLEINIVAQPRVFNLSKREADMAIAISAPSSGRQTVQKITDCKLHLAAHRRYLRGHPPIRDLSDLKQHRLVGYIPDMIFDSELDYLAEVGATRVALASNSVSVQLNIIRREGGVGIVHDFALPSVPRVRRVLERQVSLSRSFYLIRHADDRRVGRLNRVAEALVSGVRAEVARLEALVAEAAEPQT